MIPSNILELDVLAEHEEGEQHGEQQRQEMMGAGGGGAASFAYGTSGIAQDRTAEHRNPKAAAAAYSARYADIGQRGRERQQHDAGGQVSRHCRPAGCPLVEYLEQDGAEHDRGQ